MMKTAIIDYGMGNLHSVLKSAQTAAQGLNAEIFLTADPAAAASADRVIFPGQGAMPNCMKSLQDSGLGRVVADALANRPFFGICVGAQLLFENSEEGNTAGLGYFAGSVKKFRQPENAPHLKIPHMGWNTVRQTAPHPLFAGIENGAWFYFVHSYYFAPADPTAVLAASEYPAAFACAVGRDNVFATQFHPEKSHDNGIRLLRNFLQWRI